MSMDRDGFEKPVTEQEGTMFAARPIWEQRGKKRRGLGLGRKAAPAAAAPTVTPEPRTFAAERDYEEPMALDTPVSRPMADRPMTDSPMMDRPIDRPTMARTEADAYTGAGYMAGAAAAPSAMAEEADSGMVAPIGRPSTRSDRGPRSKGIGPAAIAAGVVTLGAIGAVGWYASRSNDGIPEIAPGQPTTEIAGATTLPPATLPPSPPPAQPSADTAVNPPAAAPPRATVRASAPVRQARARPAAAATPSASETGVNASTTALPAGPQPYSTLNPGAAPPAPVNPPATTTPTPPTTTEAAPAPSEAPAAIPATPPTLPSQTTPPTDPAPETTVTPPMS